MERTFADLTKYIKKSPPLWRSILFLLLIALAEYVLSGSYKLAFLLILIPSAILFFIDLLSSRVIKSKMNSKREAFLIVLNIFIFFSVYHIFNLVFPYFHFQNAAISISFSSFFRYLVFYVYMSKRKSANIFLSSIFSIVMIPVFIYSGKIGIIPESIIYSIIASFLSSLFVDKTTENFRIAFDQEPRDLINYFLFESVDRTGEINQAGVDFFKKFYSEETETESDMILLKTRKGNIKVALVFPYIHPGPFGTSGSSNLPERLYNNVKELGIEPMVFHTTTTNSDNCSGDNDINSISDGIKEMLNNVERMKSSEKCSGVMGVKTGGVRIDGVVFGDFGFAAINPDRIKFDDVIRKEGLFARDEILKKSGCHLSMIDGQNNFSYGSREITNMSQYLHGYEKLVERCRRKMYPLVAGYSRNTKDGIPSLGPMGIQSLVFRREDKLDAVILTDSNNITEDAMKGLYNRLNGIVDKVAIYTTDNHIVNSGTLSMSPLGEKDTDKVVELAVESVKNAINNMEECTAYQGNIKVRVKMGSEKSYDLLMDVVFDTIKKARRIAFMTLPIVFAVPIAISFLGIIFRIPFIY
ncbi:DUF2070 family protein [Caldiplasma sukawensis]